MHIIMGRCILILRNRPVAYDQKQFKRYNKIAHISWPLTLTLTPSTPWMPTDLGTTVCKFGHDPSICLGGEAILSATT